MKKAGVCFVAFFLVWCSVAQQTKAESITGTCKTIIIDGDLTDWNSADLMYPDEEIGDGLPLNTSYSNIYVANDDNYLYVGYELKGTGGAAVTNSWLRRLYVDTDMDADTGFDSGWMTGGYDRLVQYGSSGTVYSVFSYGGGTNQNLWAWNWLGLIEYASSTNGKFLEWKIGRDKLGMTSTNKIETRLEFNVTENGVTTETWAHFSETQVDTYTLPAAVIPSFYEKIKVDGFFSDWSEIPVAATDAVDNAAGPDFKQLWLANDDEFLYVKFTLHTATNPFTSSTHYFVDADGNKETGFNVNGGVTNFGSEIMIEGSGAYQQAGGTWNEGLLTNAMLAQIPFNTNDVEYEFRISRNCTGVSGEFDGKNLITNGFIRILLQDDNNTEMLPTKYGVNYLFAPTPPPEGSVFIVL